jgi:hypothetical protein
MLIATKGSKLDISTEKKTEEIAKKIKGDASFRSFYRKSLSKKKINHSFCL